MATHPNRGRPRARFSPSRQERSRAKAQEDPRNFSSESTQGSEISIMSEPPLLIPEEASIQRQSKAKKGRGKATGIEFERLRKNGQIPVKVPDKAKGPTEKNGRIFIERVTYLVRHFADISYRSWKFVPQKDKDELYNRILARLAYSYKSYHHQLHKIYKRFQNKEEAMANPPEELSRRFGKKAAIYGQMMTIRKLKVNHTAGSKSLLSLYEESLEDDGNKIQFYKRSHIKRDLVTWVTPTCEENYNQMIAAFAERDPSMKSVKIAEEVFYEVLGRARGMGKFVIPPPSTSARSSQIAHLNEQVQKYKSGMESYKEQYEDVKETMREIMLKQASYDEKLAYIMSQTPIPSDSAMQDP
ncbi:hypothetical protein CJ030_MR7G028002 [Morella rubra]|uniref:Uncharacterized protein n=1 Tax=Morella rubra TaxID=262757 RepID=A0A6A1UZK9_9ROSI|nr:hypothetical protein CJ030_MR7G028002 [Morella rubra]